MVASLLVIGVMIALILLSVVLFGSEVAEGALQVSMTLATLFALSVALFYGFRGGVISEAIRSSVNGTIGTIFVLLAIGAIIGTLYLSGTVAAFLYYGVEILSPRFFYVMVFIIAGVLSMLLGSSLTTVGAVGVAFVGLASIMGCHRLLRPVQPFQARCWAIKRPRFRTQPCLPLPPLAASRLMIMRVW